MPPEPAAFRPSGWFSARRRPARRLFLDDDPGRADAFLRENPGATWVRTVAECVGRLGEAWDEVHLDHDLGGEVYVDVDRADCGMEVVRRLAREPRPHLRRARFVVHTHNVPAACEMASRLRALGFRVEIRPFGLEPPEEVDGHSPGPWDRLRERALRLAGRLRRPMPKSNAGPADRPS